MIRGMDGAYNCEVRIFNLGTKAVPCRRANIKEKVGGEVARGSTCSSERTAVLSSLINIDFGVIKEHDRS